MRYDDSSGSVLNGRIKNFSWVNQALVECPDADSMGIDDPAGTIEGDSDEVFPVEMMILMQMLIDSACSCNDRILFDAMIA